jgi:Kef-type K+ transport system membrane component KefB
VGRDPFNELAIVAAVAFAVPLVAAFFHRLRLPSVVIEILAGVILGPHVLGWVQDDDAIEFLSKLGLAFLLFLAGLEIDFVGMKRNTLRVTGFAFLASVGLALVVGVSFRGAGLVTEPLLVSIALAATGLSVIVPILKDSGELSTEFGQIIITAASISEFATIFFLSLLFSAHSTSTGTQLLALGGFFLAAALTLLGVLYANRLRILSETFQRLQHTTAQIGVRASFLLLLIFVAMVDDLGLEIILGAFAAGVVFGIVDQEMATREHLHMQLQAVGFGIFIPFFFVASGVRFNFGELLESPSSLVLVPLFLLALILVRGVPALMYLPHTGKKRAVVAGLMQATSLSFIVATTHLGVELGKMTEGIAAAFIAAGLLSVLIFPLLALKILRSGEPADLEAQAGS